MESENFKILWDFTVQCDQKLEAGERGCIDVDDRVKDKELEKLEKYQLLKDEITKVWGMRKVIVVPVGIGALGAV